MRLNEVIEVIEVNEVIEVIEVNDVIEVNVVIEVNEVDREEFSISLLRKEGIRDFDQNIYPKVSQLHFDIFWKFHSQITVWYSLLYARLT